MNDHENYEYRYSKTSELSEYKKKGWIYAGYSGHSMFCGPVFFVRRKLKIKNIQQQQ
jgi:hypothetical protein